jgi:probable phosphoglycerate mutase
MIEGARLLLVRHGTTDWLLLPHNRFAGRLPGISLNDTGRAEAEALGRRLAGVGVDRIASSPLERARETAEIIARHVGRPVAIDDRLIETDLGPWEGQPVETVRRRWPEAWAAWRSTPTAVPLAGLEPVTAMADRMAACAREALDRGGTTLLVSHQDPILALVCRLLDLHLDAMRRLDIATGSLTIFEIARRQPVLVTLNSPTPAAPGEFRRGMR